MLVDDTIVLQERVSAIASDFQANGIKSFGDWLTHYEDTIDEVEGFVNTYCEKVKEERFNEIENWERVVMLNALALYIIEMDIREAPVDDMLNKILAIYVETIRLYKMKKDGLLKLVGSVFISDITLYKFIKT